MTPGRPWHLFALTALMLALLAASPVQAQSAGSPAEYQIKAAFLYKFLGFIEWPPQTFATTDTPLVIGVLGAGALADELAQIVASRQVNGRPVTVRRLQQGDTADGLHVLFVGRQDSPRLHALLATAKGRPLLSVTESAEALSLGSAINFVVVDDKVRFDVALRPVEQSSLKISSRLLTVARRVVPSPS